MVKLTTWNDPSSKSVKAGDTIILCGAGDEIICTVSSILFDIEQDGVEVCVRQKSDPIHGFRAVICRWSIEEYHESI